MRTEKTARPTGENPHPHRHHHGWQRALGDVARPAAPGRAPAGTENLRRVIEACVEFGIRYLTIYAFSTENWGRPQEEVQGLMHILEDVIDRELQELHDQGVQLRHIGRLDRLNPSLREKVLHAIELTKRQHPPDAERRLQLRRAGRDRLRHPAHHRGWRHSPKMSTDRAGQPATCSPPACPTRT